MAAQVSVNSTHPTVPLARFEPLDASVSLVAEFLRSEKHRNATQSHEQLVKLRSKLHADKTALDEARVRLVAARAALKHERSLATLVVPTALNLGKLLDVASIINFAPQDTSWLESVEVLAARLAAHSETGAGVAAVLLARVASLEAAEKAVAAAVEDAAQASAAFSATYRHLSNALAFGRAVLTMLGVTVPQVSKVAPRKRKSAPAEKPVTLAPAA